MSPQFKTMFALLTLTIANAQAATCPENLAPKNGAPVLAPGFQARLIANGLKQPRGLVVDSAGHLLAVQSNVGITSFTLAETNGCVSVASKGMVASTVGVCGLFVLDLRASRADDSV
jgi:hypothetical protein